MNKKRRVALVVPYFPYPPVHGGIVRIYNLLKFMGHMHDIYLITFIQRQEQLLHIPGLKKYCRKVFPVSFSKTPLDDSYPYAVREFYCMGMAHTIRRVIKQEKIDLLHIEYAIIAGYVNFSCGIKTILTQHDTSDLFFDRSIHNRELSDKNRYTEWKKLVRYETNICGKFNKIITVTQKDKNELQAVLPSADIEVVPTGVDTKFFSRAKTGGRATSGSNPAYGCAAGRDSAGGRTFFPADGFNLTYVGHYHHYPNEDAMVYFCKKILPLITGKLPNVKLYIVGSGPTEKILKLQEDRHVRVTGGVPDVRPYLKNSDVFVAPSRVGGGIKGKILEAMSMGVPVVTNKLGSYGIEARHGKEIIITDTPGEFAAETVKLLKNARRRKGIAVNARGLVERKYDWRAIAKRLAEIYRNM
ncbi:MAG: glycosyltransferase [Elusimicrobia bacterium]|nr:glycosyltransferase [Elusimicrobiota bacterium]